MAQDPQRPDSFDPSKHYRHVLAIAERDAEDWAINEAQKIQDLAREELGDAIFKTGGILRDPKIVLPGTGHISFSDFSVWLFGHAESIAGATLAYDAGKTSGVDVVFARWLADRIGSAQDPILVAPATGEDVEERIREQAELAIANQDAFDEPFAQWVGPVPLNWTLVSGGSAKGFPPKFGESGLQLNHTNGTDTSIERVIKLDASTTYYLYYWARTQEDQQDLDLSDGAYVGLFRASPAFSQQSAFDTIKEYARHTLMFTTDGSFVGSQWAVTLRIFIPAAVASTQILVDAILVTKESLADLELDRHYVPLYLWDRATDDVQKAVPRAGNIHMGDWQPYLDGFDIINIEHNQGLLDFAARRTFDTHGNYHVPGGILIERNTSLDDDDNIGLRVTPGKAYVQGYEVLVSASVDLTVPKAVEVGIVIGEQITFYFSWGAGDALYALEKTTELFSINNTFGLYPVKQITQFTV